MQLSLSQCPVYPLLGSHIREGCPSLAPARAHKSGRKGAALVAATACAVSLVSWHTVSYCSFQLGTPSSSAERTHGEAVVVGGGIQDSPPVNHRAGNSRWDPDWPQGRPCSCSGPGGRPLQACPQQAVKPFEKLASIYRAELPDCGRLAFPWSQSLDRCPSSAGCLHRSQMSVLTKITLSLSPGGPGFLRALRGPG